ncbi:hydrogenase maturation protease [Lentzea tibetensis]|uniref:Hydrogenase maturation protease n=1 Tax=Lentzea tibetensis TaxID=2591470 RepID=A0A563F380_9PSEU|nr:hydrogenase maturation protease [Lentzea tibetensis]TWP54221.1 hydrogenase maturation protease [Lentzea tibetensis]
MTRMLVAGVGNVLLGDDGFGCEVARRLCSLDVPEDVRVKDFGIRGVHLAYELLDGWDVLVLVDASPRGLEPGSVTVLEVDVSTVDAAPLDAHDLDPDKVLGLLRALGGSVHRVLLVACEPADTSPHLGLSPAVEAAVEPALRAVQRFVATKEELCS